jgi:hypothetical protein
MNCSGFSRRSGSSSSGPRRYGSAVDDRADMFTSCGETARPMLSSVPLPKRCSGVAAKKTIFVR